MSYSCGWAQTSDTEITSPPLSRLRHTSRRFRFRLTLVYFMAKPTFVDLGHFNSNYSKKDLLLQYKC